MRKFLSAIALSCTAAISSAQQVRPASSDKIYNEICGMRHLVNVLYVAAHPDDENTRLLAWLVNDRHIRTAYLSLTRGDGGQNILGSEQGDALGLIRTHELMEARKIDGAEQFFSRAIDFGFSKNYKETFKHWPENALTGDVVWVMRKYRPDVVICRFPPNKDAGHGQHAASAILAADAFKAAGDKNQYTEQLQYYPAWQPKRLLLNTYRFGDRNTTSEDQFKLKVGQYVPTLGMGSGELAGISRSVHKSQGAGTPSVPGIQTEYFKLVSGDSITTSLFDGIDITWGRVQRPDIGADLKVIAETFDFEHPGASIPALIAVRKKIATVKDDYWRTQKLKDIDKTILDCSGVMAEIYAKVPQAIAGASLPFTLHVIARPETPVVLKNISWGVSDTAVNRALPADTLLSIEHVVTIPSNAPVTQPYWLAKPHTQFSLFTVPADTLLGLTETPDNLNAILGLNIGGVDIDVPVPLSYKKLDPVKGDVVEQLRVVPDVSLNFVTSLLIAHKGQPVMADVHIHAFKDVKNATLVIYNKEGAVPAIDNITLAANTDTVINVNIPEFVMGRGNDGYYLWASVSADGKTYDQWQELIQYSHIPTLQYFNQPCTRVINANWKCTAKRIGYVEGAGDYIPTLLRLAGLDVDILKEADFSDPARLKKYDAIVTGIRAVNVEKRMATWMPILLKYAENGGTLVMQYNTTQDMSTTKLGPYPFTIASDLRVTEEDAKIDFTDSKSRLLNYPNKITAADFDNWVQERGLYFASKWDEKYATPFSMHDADEQALMGSTLYTKWGKGSYIYTTLSFSRQLPAGNAGAIRMLMNMLSVGK